MKVGDIYYIKWEDSQGCPMGWAAFDDCRNRSLAAIESVGWVSHLDKRAVTLTPHIATVDEQPNCASGFVTIPLSGVLLKQKIIKK